MNAMKNICKILIALSVLTITGCATVKEIPTDLTAAQIIQLGQDAYDLRDYKTAINCYQTVINRFGTNAVTLIEAKYELGHVYLAEKKYDKAYEIFSEILEIYDSVPYSDLPAAYKKLATIGIERIPENKRTAANPSEEE